MSNFDYAKLLNASIREAEWSYNRAAEGLKYAIERAQETCTHEVVVYADYQRLEYLSSLPPIRMCLVCRLEEHAASLYHEGNKLWPKGTLNPTEHTLYVKLSREEIYRLRLDGSKIRKYQSYDD